MKIRMVKVKAGQRKLRERIKDALAKKGARASILINKLAANKKAVIWKPAELDAIALELRLGGSPIFEARKSPRP